jgi:hypothetical protein
MKLELNEQEISIILQTLNNVSVPVKEAYIAINIINNIQKQIPQTQSPPIPQTQSPIPQTSEK